MLNYSISISDRTLWSLWALIFLSVLTLYTVYALLLSHALSTKLRYLRPAPRPTPFGGSWEQKVAHHGHPHSHTHTHTHTPSHGSSRSAGRAGPKNAPAALADRSRTRRVVRDLERTLLVGRWELAGFGVFCGSWGGLSLYRGVRGLGLMVDLRGWGRVAAGSLWVATACAVVAVVCVILRARVMLAAQERALSSVASLTSNMTVTHSTRTTHHRSRSGSGRPNSIVVTVETTYTQEHDYSPDPPDSPACTGFGLGAPFGPGCVHLHEPARPEPVVVRVRFPGIGEEDELDGAGEDEKKGGKAVVLRQDSQSSTRWGGGGGGAGWAPPAGWGTPRLVGSPVAMSMYEEEGAGEIEVLGFGPLVGAGTPPQPEQGTGSPEIEEK